MFSVPAASRALPAEAAIPYADPVAMQLLSGTAPEPALGEFATTRGGLGFFGITIAAVLKATPFITEAVKRLTSGSAGDADPIEHIWQSIPPSAINAKEGPGGWWVDLADGHQLTHEEAAARQQAITAASIGATIGADGWWMKDGQQLSHAQAWTLYQKLAGLAPTGGSGTTAANGGTVVRTGAGGSTTMAGMSTTTILLVVGAAVALTMFSKRRRA